jgi:hypothetical protein
LRAQAQRVFLAVSARHDVPCGAEPDPPTDARDGRASCLSAHVDEAGRERTHIDVSGEAPAPSGPQPTELTQQVRALYEDSIVPVREIARRVGIHERTLYKYVTKGGWRRRYRVKGAAFAGIGRAGTLAPDAGKTGARDGDTLDPGAPDNGRDAGTGDAVPARISASRRRSAPRVLAKGAGGRYIRAEDAGKPHRSGLKALDPEGEASALVRCRSAASVSDQAVSRTRRLREAMSDARTLAILVGVVRDLMKLEDRALDDSVTLKGARAGAGGATAKTKAKEKRLAAPAGGRDLEEQRRALARKLDAWVRTQEDLAKGEGT